MGEYAQPLGWFTDETDEDDSDHNEDFPWRPFLQIPGMVVPLPISFQTEAACLDFIRTDVLGKGLFPGEGGEPEASADAVAGA